MPDESECAYVADNRRYMPRILPHAPKIHHRGSHLAACLLAGLVALASLALAPAAKARGPQPGQFDYYTLSLSWSPTYCASQAGRNDRQQCGLGRAYAFVVHGLWPQYHQGWPQDCALREKWVPDDLITAMLDIMPSKR